MIDDIVVTVPLDSVPPDTSTPLNVTTNVTLPFGNVDAPYTQTLAASGGTGAFTWTLQAFNYLPPGLTLSSIGTISGTPAATGQFSFAVIVSDTASHMLSRTFFLSIYPAGVTPPLFLNIGPNFGTRSFGTFNLQLTTTGGRPPYHYSLTPGATVVPGMRVQDGQPLPIGFTATGGYLGVLTTPGVFNTSIRVTDSVGSRFDRAITFTVSPLQILSQSSVPKATVNTPYSFTMTPYGGSGTYTWSATNLPAGITMSASGLLAGTPTSSGNFFPSVTLTDTASNTLTSSFTLTVDPFAITTNGVLPSAVVGVPYSQTLSAPNCSSSCTWTTSSIFGGLTLNSAGILSGTPTSSGTGSFTFQVTGSNRTVSKVFSLLITSNTAQPLSILNASSLGFTTIGAPVASSLFGFGGTAPYTFTVQSGTLPPGVTLQSPGESLGALLGPGFYYLAGRAMQVGDYSFTLAVTDAANATVTKAFSWVITPIAHQYFSLPISGTPLVYNTAYTQPLLAIGGDAVGRKRSITDPMGHTTQVTYDGAGRLLTTTDPLTHFVGHLYDADEYRLLLRSNPGDRHRRRQNDVDHQLLHQLRNGSDGQHRFGPESRHDPAGIHHHLRSVSERRHAAVHGHGADGVASRVRAGMR